MRVVSEASEDVDGGPLNERALSELLHDTHHSVNLISKQINNKDLRSKRRRRGKEYISELFADSNSKRNLMLLELRN